MKLNIALVSIVLLAVISCKEPVPVDPPVDTEYVQISLQPFFDTEELDLEQVYTTDEGYKLQFVNIKAYFCQIKNGSNVLMTSSLFDFAERGTLLRKVVGDYTKFGDIKALLGVDEVSNHADPTQFASDDPLNIMLANDMHWDWNPGYIFLKVEAKADTLVDANTNLDLNLSYHVGGDNFLQNLNLPGLTWQAVAAHTHEAKLKVDMKYFFTNPVNPINMKTESATHSGAGGETLALKVIQNFKSALSVY